jgi:hypothetical protein
MIRFLRSLPSALSRKLSPLVVSSLHAALSPSHALAAPLATIVALVEADTRALGGNEPPAMFLRNDGPATRAMFECRRGRFCFVKKKKN